MRIKKVFLEASFISFLIHALIILYLLGFFYFESPERAILSKPIEVNLIFKENEEKNKKVSKVIPNSENLKKNDSYEEVFPEKSISFDSLITTINVEELLAEDELISSRSQDNQTELYSSLMIQSIQSAWRKPINVQDGLVCNLRLSINKNGRITKVNLIKSSGNLRFDNSAIKAVQRVETFSFLKNISYSLYNNNFKSIVITFNPT
tara:strand:- start:158 stop:778 length:621 start_codon:yes stop_codon:yes gene_type:complete